jgi:hypothetical protein
MTKAERQIPDWAALEREKDRLWIRQNLDVFWHTAQQGSQFIGRGAIFVDVDSRPMGNQNLFTYFTVEEIERYENQDLNRLVGEYDLETEFVIALLKPQEKVSSYRVQPVLPNSNHESN